MTETNSTFTSNPNPPSRSRRIAIAGAGVAAFTLAGGAAVWALSPGDRAQRAESGHSSATTTIDDVTMSSTTVSSGDHQHEVPMDDVVDRTAAEAVECDLPVASDAGTSDQRHTLHDSTDGRVATADDCLAGAAWYQEVSEAALARFSDVADAIDAGYRINRQSEESANPLDHYSLHGGNDAVLDSELPEGLVYWTDPDTGETRLFGAVFIEHGDDLPQPGGPLTVWHDHHDATSCVEVNPDCDLETAAANAPRMLHVWFFEDVVDVFAHDYPGAVGESGRQARRG